MMLRKSYRRVLASASALVATILFGVAHAQFVAFNDHAPGPGTSTNATTWDIFGNAPGSTGPLKNIVTGANLPVILTITRTDSGISGASTQGSPADGTPLFNAFNGFVDFQGTPNSSVELTEGGLVTYSFTGLNPNKRYSFMGSAVRGNAAYTDRWTLFELAGAVSFKSAHTANVITTDFTPLVSPNQAALNTGVNNTPESGDMVVWLDIDPGPEGSFTVSCQQYSGPVPNGGSSAGTKGYGMTGIRLEEFDVSKTPPAITNQPQSIAVDEGHSAVFSVGATGNPPPTLQWYRNDAAIPGETNTTLTIPSVQVADDGAIFKAIASSTISNVLYTAVSSNAVLRVNLDVTLPTLTTVQPVGLTQVKLTFSEKLDPASATNLANFSISSPDGSLTVSNATLDATQTILLLDVRRLTENVSYTLAVSGVKDIAGNAIAANTQRTFSPVVFTPLDIGAVGLAGSITAVQNGYDIRGAGLDIGGSRDQFQYAYETLSGDFDVRVRLADLTVTESFVKGGLMIRDTLADNARFAAILGSSAQLGTFFEARATASGTASLTAPANKFPANYPWTWLRLQRAGANITGFASFDGKAWQQIGTTSMALSANVYFGMAVTSAATNKLTTAKFRDLSAVDNPTAFTYSPAREWIGPSNRRTGIIFSEVMYHPKARADALNLDFIEIYNGEPIFIDLTGWKISGGVDYAFPNGFKIEAGQFVVIAADPTAVQSIYGISGVLGPFKKNLNESGETLRLKNTAGATRNEFTYSDKAPWPTAADGAGHSLVMLRPSYGEEDPRAWSASQLIGGSPGFDDPIVPNPWAGVVINEFLAAPSAGQNAFVELYNASTNEVDISGCFLTDSTVTNKFRIGNATRLPAGGWISFETAQLGFTLPSGGGTIYLVSADQTRVLDAARFGGQELGVSFGRAPDGSPTLRRLADSTPSQHNSRSRAEDIVINELMYKPISGEDDDQYVELYNRTAAAINLGGWRFTEGIDFTIPAGTSIAANGYMVIARNLQRMLTNYTQLNATNAVGDFDGKLKGGEHVALAKPGVGTNEFVVVSEVTFETGGRWPELANGGGSSLELKDAHADLSQASNWASSDETQKSTYATYEQTASLTLANQVVAANKFFIMCQGEGEYLIDDIEVVRQGTNLLTNPGFESGQTGWNFYGTHNTSSVQGTGAATGASCLHIRCTEVGDEGPNSIRGTLNATIAANTTVTVRAKIRWLAGWPEFLLRVRGNGIEFPVRLRLPSNLGTPGLPNSRKVANAGPSIAEVTHSPAIPAASQPVVVTARISDPDGVGLAQVILRPDPGTTTSTILMRDDGAGGDALAGDGIYTATIPGRAGSSVAAFRVQAADGAGAAVTSLFPSDAPTRECIIRWGDPTPFGSLANYYLWSTTASASDLTSQPAQDRRYRDITFVYDNRVIYNAGWRNKGSPFHGGFGSYSLGFNDDDLFLGADKHVLRSTGNGGDESTEMADDMAYWVAEKMGVSFNHARYARLYRNGSLHYRLDYDVEVPDRSIAKDWFGGGGLDDTLYKIAGWFEYDDSNTSGTGSLQWATGAKKPANAPPYKTAAYRFNFQPHPGGRTADDYSVLFNIITGMNAADKVTQLMNVADMENWMRNFALRRVLGDWDSWSYQTGQNMYLYAPLGERARLMPWDMDFVLGMGNGVGTSLFQAGQDSVVGGLMATPTYARMMYRAYQDAANGPLVKEISDPQFDARQKFLNRNGITSTAPTSLKSFVASQRTSLLSTIRASDATAFSITAPPASTTSSTITLTGSAPFGIATIEINGVPYPVTWTGNTSWSVKVPLGAPTNVLQIVGKDLRGNVYTNGTKQVTIAYTGAALQAADWVVINEIMYNASVTDAEFIELYNNHPTALFDLSGYRLKGADFDFPAGTFIQPGGYLVIAKDSAAFASAYGGAIPIVGEYSGRLLNTGETLSLVKPGATAAQDVVVDEVHYDSLFPWPPTANGFGPSLQRIDSTQDSWRAGNWSVTGVTDANRATPGRVNVNRTNLDPFPTVWINEVLPNQQTKGGDSFGEHDPWIELYNSSTNAVDLSLYYLSNDPASPNLWQFPAGTVIGAGQFLLVWADGQPEQTSATELHTNFRLSAAGGLVAFSRVQLGAPAVVDYVYYSAANPDQSYGSIFDGDGDPETRRFLFAPTPGGPNNPGDLFVPVSINEWMASNTKTLADPADGDFDDWFELYNRGTNTVDLTSYFLSNSATNATKFRVPAGYSIPPHGFLLVWADDETQNATNRPDLHVNFKLSKNGDAIALFTPNGALIDTVSFGAQLDNASAGRYPDGASVIAPFPTPTPRAENVQPVGTSFTRVTIDAGQLSIAWKTTAGHTYRLESKSDLNQATWTPVGADLVASGPSLSANLAIAAGANAYYRVVQVN